MPTPETSFLNWSSQQRQDFLAEINQPKFREAQIIRWLFARRAKSFDEMTDLPKALRSRLTKDVKLWSATIAKHSKAADGTEKLLVSLEHGGQIECVLLHDRVRTTICISTQVGCAMGCVFCASGLDGVDRNLTSGEIVEQMLLLNQLLKPDERISHVVVMGMGEPLANIDALLEALSYATDENGLGISARRITISTVGLPKAMRKLTNQNTRYRLAVSLHAPTDELRNQLVPVNRRTGLSDVLAEADRYFKSSGRQLTFEYVLLANINDRAEHAQQLANLLAHREAMLNVIPYNPVSGLPYQSPSRLSRENFKKILTDRGVQVKFRHRKGDKIDAACGQLRRSAEATPNEIVELKPLKE